MQIQVSSDNIALAAVVLSPATHGGIKTYPKLGMPWSCTAMYGNNADYNLRYSIFWEFRSFVFPFSP